MVELDRGEGKVGRLLTKSGKLRALCEITGPFFSEMLLPSPYLS